MQNQTGQGRADQGRSMGGGGGGGGGEGGGACLTRRAPKLYPSVLPP